MTKAKIILSALAILAVTGGALAYKAQKGAKIYCTDQPGKLAGIDCPTFENWTITLGSQTRSYCTLIPFEECVEVWIKFQQ